MTTTQPRSGADPTTGGLRERAKAKRRAALQLAAVRLFAERGYEHTTLADIAEAAEVAPRTIAGYFASKAELATSVGDDIVARLIAAYRDHPDATYLEVMDLWLTAEEQQANGQLARLAEAMYGKNPALRAVNDARAAEARQLAQPLLEAELHLSPDHPMFGIAQSTLGSAIGGYLAFIAQHGADPDMHAAILGFLESVIRGARDAAPDAPRPDGSPPRPARTRRQTRS